MEYTLSDIACRINENAEAFVRQCEHQFQQSVRAAADAAFDRGCELIMLAGPSSSGKTTTASFLAERIRQRGGKAYTVSLDDFYLDKGTGPRNPDGSFDFESVQALDIPCIRSCLADLVKERQAFLPVFDFITGKRKEQPRHIVLEKNDVLIIEGLHALNPAITGQLPPEELFLLYISVSSRIFDGGGVFLSKRELRFIRRLIRDYRSRASSPEETFAIWQQVLAGEDQYLFPFEDRAHMRIDSLHPYEPCVFAPQGIRLLSMVPQGSPFYANAAALTGKLEQFPHAESSLVPADSLLREFLG